MEIALGTVQFGRPYGIANHKIVPPSEVEQILRAATAAGVNLVDTAPDYGSSQAVLGRYLDPNAMIVTKTPRFTGDAICVEDVRDFLTAFDRSLHELGRSSVYGLLVHYCEDVLKPGGRAIFDALQQLKLSGRVDRIGVSAYRREQVEQVLELHEIDIVQLPINVFDQRATSDDFLSNLRGNGIEIHARSAFLQGLLLLDPDSIDPYFDRIREDLRRYHDALQGMGLSAVEAALAFIRKNDRIAYVVIGVKSTHEFREIIAAWSSPPPVGVDFSAFALDDETILNPSQWQLS